MNKAQPFQQSVSQGIRNVSRLSEGVFLFDGCDSTSLLGSYEVLRETRAWYLFKPALLPFSLYRHKSAFNVWFFGPGSGIDKGYEIPANGADRIRLSGWNLGHYRDHQVASQFLIKTFDVSAIFRLAQKGRAENRDHGFRNDIYYRAHRSRAKSAVERLAPTWRTVTGQAPPEDTNMILRRSRTSVSPYGMGEICYRDFEIGLSGAALIKPTMGAILTKPDIFRDGITYFAVKPDFSDLDEKVSRLLADGEHVAEQLSENFRTAFLTEYDVTLLAEYWRQILREAQPRC